MTQHSTPSKLCIGIINEDGVCQKSISVAYDQDLKMDLINPNSSKDSNRSSLRNFLKNINPLLVIPPKIGAFAVAIIDLILTFAAVICGILLEVYLIYPAAFETVEVEDEYFGNQYTVTSIKKIYIFLVLVGMLVIALSEYGLFTILRDGITQKDKHLCGLWFEIRFLMFCVLFGGSLTYGLIMRYDTFSFEIGVAFPFFLYKFCALWIVKHFQYKIVYDPELKEELMG